MEWLVRLQISNSRVHQRLIDLFSLPELTIEEYENQGVVMRSTTFVAAGFGIDAPATVAASADELLKTVQGGIKVALGHSLEIMRGHVIRVDDDGVTQQFVVFEELLNLVDEPVIVVTDDEGNEIQVSTPIDPVPNWFQLALTNQNVRNALNRLSKESLGWGDLYAVLEAVRNDVNNRIVNDNWATQPELTLFNHTANNVQALGEEARHALPAYSPPANPMTYVSARSLIERIVIRWLSWRQANP